MYFTTNRRWSSAVVWCFWFLVLLTVAWHGGPPWATVPRRRQGRRATRSPCSWYHRRHGVHRGRGSHGGRWRKWAVARYQAAQRTYQRAVWAARGARLLLQWRA